MHFRNPLTLSLLGLASASPITSRNDPDPPKSPAGCADTTFGDFVWTVHTFDYHASYTFTTPAHQNSWGYVSFELSNPADQTTVHCEGASSQLSDFFYGTMEYNCNDTLRAGASSFNFNRPSGQLRVEQKWMCDDRDPQWPITITARGDTNLTLECSDTTWENPDWKMGQIYSSRIVQCAPVDAKIKPTEMEAIA